MITTLTPSPSIDLDYYLANLNKGEVNRAEVFASHAGGKGVNVSRVLTYMNVRNVAIVPMAKTNRDFFLGAAESENINLEIVHVNSPLRFNVSLVHEGLTTKVNAESASWSVLEARKVAKKFRTRARRSEFSVIGGSLPSGLSSDWIFQLVSENAHRTKVVVDCSGEALLTAIAAKPFLIKPNKDEAEQIIGYPISSMADAIEACNILRNKGANNVLLSLGNQGSLFFNGKEYFRAESRKINATNTVGAGDSLLAGFLGKYKSGPLIALASGTAWSESAINARSSGVTIPPVKLHYELIKEIDPQLASLRVESFNN